MGLSNQQQNEIEQVLKKGLRHKFNNYHPEPASMPFHTRLLGNDRLALYSFIHSLSTNFGTTIFEPVAVTIAKSKFRVVSAHTTVGSYIYSSAQDTIQKIINGLTTADNEPDKIGEIKAIRKICQTGTKEKVKLTQADLYLEDKQGKIYMFDIKTAKPNAGSFREFKRTLLEWVATVLANNSKAKVNT